MELNPNNPVTKQMHDNWHAVVAVLLQQMGVTEFEITPEMLTRLSASNRLAVVADARGGRFVLRAVTMEEGERLAKEQK